MLIGREGYDPIFDQQTSMKGAPPNSHFGKDFPFMLYKCSLTNFGKGVASGVELKVKVRFGDQASLMSGLGRFSEPQYLSIKVPILPPLASYVFLVGSRNALTASVQPAQEMTVQNGWLSLFFQASRLRKVPRSPSPISGSRNEFVC